VCTYRELFRAPEFTPFFLASSVPVAAQTMSSLALGTLIYPATGSPLLSALAIFGPSLTQVTGANTAVSSLAPCRSAVRGRGLVVAARIHLQREAAPHGQGRPGAQACPVDPDLAGHIRRPRTPADRAAGRRLDTLLRIPPAPPLPVHARARPHATRAVTQPTSPAPSTCKPRSANAPPGDLRWSPGRSSRGIQASEVNGGGFRE
jgi:hypothetical protein